jgi:hypothetical protein
MRLSQFNDMGHGFEKLTDVDSNHFFIIFVIEFFLVSYINIRLIGIDLYNIFFQSTFYEVIIIS